MKERSSKKHNTTEYKEAEELYKTLANSSPVGIYIAYDGKFRLIHNFQSRQAIAKMNC